MKTCIADFHYNEDCRGHMETLDARFQITAAQQQVVLDTLRAILESSHFSKSTRSRTLLEFAVRDTLKGNSGALKERTVGVEVFGRPADYDTNSDPVVRTAAVEVRRRITQYFSEHPESPIRIELPSGSYRAVIHFRTEPEVGFLLEDPQTSHSLDDGPGDPQLVSDQVEHAPVYPTATTQVAIGTNHWWKSPAVLAIAGVILVAAAGVAFWRSQPDRELREFWGPVLKSTQQPLILIGRTSEGGGDDGPGSTEVFNASGFRSMTLDDAIAAAQVCGVFSKYERECKIQAVQGIGGDEISNRSIVLIGGLGTPWAQKFLTPLLYYPQLAPATTSTANGTIEIMKRQPTGDIPLWKFNRSEAPSLFDRDYAIIARYRNEITGSMTVVLGGLGFRGTNSAGQFIASPDKLRDLLSRAPKGWKGTNFEAVLQIDLVQGTSSNSTVLTSYFW